ncbi:MAG: hypothetical protein MR625_06890 [Clostridium sp.]|nr:hypothetical protein [Clostridium sp.]
MLENGKITPRGREREASGVEQSVRKREDYSKRKRKRSKQVGGEVVKSEKSPKLKNKG